MLNSPLIKTKLPLVGTTIFTVMSKLAADYNAINLSQGFPNFKVSDELIELVNRFMKAGYNQYAPMIGVQELREAIVQKVYSHYGVSYDSETEITVTSGATEALFASISAVVQKGDEVIVFEPAYDSYVPAILLNGGVPVYISLRPPYYNIDWQEVKSKVSRRTRLIIINTPQNPAGTILMPHDIAELASIVDNTNILLVGDEVYEHIIFDNEQHQSLMTHQVLRERSYICGSFGKTFHVTGWKVGYVLAPSEMTTEFRKIHQYLTFSTITPVQMALACYLGNAENYLTIPEFYQRKRDLFLEALKHSKFKYIPARGSYFQNLDYSTITLENDYDFATRLTKEKGVASIPVSMFYHRRIDYKILRFCFAKDDATLLAAAEKLSGL